MIDAFQRFVPIDESLVAPDSLLREFIGGSAYSTAADSTRRNLLFSRNCH